MYATDNVECAYATHSNVYRAPAVSSSDWWGVDNFACRLHDATASTVQCRPALGSLTRPVPRLGGGVLPAPTIAQVPASIFDVRLGETLVGMPDGLAHSVPVPHFSEGELARLSALGGVDAVSELLQANPLRPVNFSDAHVRLAAEREMLAFIKCYGVEGCFMRHEYHSLVAVSYSARFDSGGSTKHPSGFSSADRIASD
ncbi:unnamed protein product [Phytophthora fragariaefolia]|uniref:Unnamed protein product n=1 Tax=Phytophthora fragariaefolia TaxID=1490495 RepID=A0A9W6XD00_9STRA|nr:unnamed protein product [Phytophthora fragariaefolia]